MIVEFQDAFIAKLQNRYIVDNKTQILNNKRYYMASLEIEGHSFILCIPLHSNGKYFIPIEPPISSTYSVHWKNPGLNLEKMLILTEQEICIHGSKFNIENNVWEDIKLKKNKIQKETKKYLVNFLYILKRKNSNQFLTKSEKTILKYSSLNAFSNEINILSNSKEINLKFVDLNYLFD